MSVPVLRFPEFEGEWEESEFDEVFQAMPTRNHQILASEVLEKGEYPVVDQGKEELAGYSNDSSKLLNDVPLVLFGDHTTVLKFVDYPFVIGADGTKPLKVKQGDAAFQFFNLLLNNVEQEGYKRHFSILRQLVISSPSHPEQKKIAALLGVVDAKIAALRARVAGLERYKRGLMQALFSQTLRFTKPDGSAFPDWEEKRLGEVCSFHKGKGIAKADIADDGSLACIRYGELYTRYTEIIPTALSKTNVPAEELFLSEPDDVIIPASGEDRLDMARACCVKQRGVALGGDLNVLRGKANGDFLAYYLSKAKRKDIARFAQGNSVVHLYGTQLKVLDVAIPHPDEQTKIADALTAMDAKIAAVGDQVAKMEAFKKGLLQQMFV